MWLVKTGGAWAVGRILVLVPMVAMQMLVLGVAKMFRGD